MPGPSADGAGPFILFLTMAASHDRQRPFRVAYPSLPLTRIIRASPLRGYNHIFFGGGEVYDPHR